MRDIKERKANLKKMLDDVVDPVLLARGFTRRKGSIKYKLKLPEAEQEIVFWASYSPRYERDAEAHIHPHFVLRMPKVQEVSLRLAGGDESILANAPDITLNLPIAFAAPKQNRPRWFTYSSSDYPTVGAEICCFMATWLYDFIENLTEPDDLIRANKTSDERILTDDIWCIKVAAAHLLKGDRAGALTVLEGRFKRPGMLRRYAVVFETLPDLEV